MTVTQGSIAWGVKPNDPGEDDWFQYTVGDVVGSAGGAGIVHRLAPDTEPPLVGKFYNETLLSHIRHEDKYYLRVVLPAWHRNLLLDDLPFATWPRRVLFDAHDRESSKDWVKSHIIGFTMPLLLGTIPLLDLITKQSARIRLTPHDTLHLATTIAHQLAQMHRHPWSFVFGDLTPNNIHISSDFAKATFIDTDSFQFTFGGAYAFLLSGLTSTFSSPGSRDTVDKKGRLTATHDDFVLAIIIFMMLMADKGLPVHPFSSLSSSEDDLIDKRQFPYDDPATNPVSQEELDAYRSLPDEVRAAFTQTFTQARPITAAHWTDVLTNMRRSLWRS